MFNFLRRSATGLLVVWAVLQIGSTHHLQAVSSGIVISQVYGAGGNSGAVLKNDFVELFNRGTAPVSLAGTSVQYASATGTGNFSSNAVAVLPSVTLQPGQYFLVQLAGGTNGAALPAPDATGTVNMSGTGGKVALVNSVTGLACNGGSTLCTAAQLALIIDLVGWDGANFFESAPAPATSVTTAAIRKNGGATDTDNNAADFEVGAPTPRNSSCTLAGGCPAATNPTISATPTSVAKGDPVRLAVSVTPGANPASTGILVTGNLSAIGGSSTQTFFDDGTNGDATAGDLVFTFTAPAISQIAAFSLPITASDAQFRSAAATLQLTVVPLLAIHDIQGAGTVSPYVGQKIATDGIVTGVKFNGFFIQAPFAEEDSDPNTSEGVFVFTNSPPGPPAAAVVGNRVRVFATVSEFGTTGDPAGLSMTELIGPTVTFVSSDNTLPDPIPLTGTELNPATSIFALEKYEGMRVHVDAVVSTSPTDGTVSEPNATSTSSGLFFGVLPGTARPFREAGIQTPLPVPAEAPLGTTPPVFDANPERIGVDTFSVFLDPATAKVFPPPAGTTLEVTTGVTVTGITGPLDYAFRSYVVDAEGWNMPVVTTPNASVQPVRFRTNDEFTVATMNLARFFDTTDDAGISDVALTPAAFATRLSKASSAILTVMRSPDVIGVEEMENLTTLQTLADRVNSDAPDAAQPLVHYEAFLQEGNDIGGIDVGFLVRTDKVSVNGVEQYGKDTTFVEPGGATALLNDRPSLILHAAVQNPPYEPVPVTIVVNHLRSLSGIDGSDGARIRAKRLAQAVDLGNKLQALESAGDRVVSVGDYNAFDVNDGYVDVMGLLKGTEVEASQVTLWAVSPVTTPLFDLIDLAPADQRYSFLFDGNAQELDHILYSGNVIPTAIGYARMNADFPESLRGDSTRPERLSDHDPIVGYFVLPDIDTVPPVIQTVTPSTTTLWPPNGKMMPVSINVAATDAVGVAECRITGVSGDDGAVLSDWSFAGLTVNLAARRSGGGNGRTYTIGVECVDGAGNVSAPRSTTVFVPHDQRK